MNLTPAQVAEKLRSAEPPGLLDVREPEEHEIVALAGARLIPLGQLFHRAGEVEEWKDREVVVYCHHGIRSQQAIGILRQLGFTKLFNLAGGIDAWSREIDPALPRY